MTTSSAIPTRVSAPDSLEVFDIPDLLEELKREEPWHAGKRNAMTLLKDKNLSVVLVVMHGGSSIEYHQTRCPVTVQVVEGQLRINTDKESVNVGTGEIATLPAGLRHSLEALQECGFLLTLGGKLSDA